MANDPSEMKIAHDGAKEILSQIDAWLSEPGATFVLGAGSEYTLADVIITTMLTRL
jgi:hypothetical protein